MADTAGMLRLMRHAANLLDDCDPMAAAEQIEAITSGRGHYVEAAARAARDVAAIATATTVLRMVAACMADEPQDEVPP